MARLFDALSLQYLEISRPAVTGTPLTIGAWFRTSTAAVSMAAVAVGDALFNQFILQIRGGGAGFGDVRALSINFAQDAAVSAKSFFSETWHHACAVFESTTSRAAYLDGAGKGTSVVLNAPVGMTTTGAGRWAGFASQYYTGMLAEAAIWSAALTDHEVYLLSTGIPPLFVRPQNLAAYWPLVSAEDFDWFREFDFTAFNSPGIAPHPPKVMQFWQKYRMRAVTTQGISRLVSWGQPNVWRAHGKASVVAAGPFLTTYGGYSTPVG